MWQAGWPEIRILGSSPSFLVKSLKTAKGWQKVGLMELLSRSVLLHAASDSFVLTTDVQYCRSSFVKILDRSMVPVMKHEREVVGGRNEGRAMVISTCGTAHVSEFAGGDAQ